MTPEEATQNLFEAAKGGNVRAAREALEKGADPNARDDLGQTPMQLAVWKGHADLMNLLQEAATRRASHADRVANLRDTSAIMKQEGEHLQLSDKQQQALNWYADTYAEQRQSDDPETLKRNLKEIFLKDAINGPKMIQHIAAMHQEHMKEAEKVGQADRVANQRGSDERQFGRRMTHVTEDRITPEEATQELFEAAKAGNVNAAREALEEGADPTARDDLGQTPMQLAVWKGNADVPNHLLKRERVTNSDVLKAKMLEDSAQRPGSHADRVADRRERESDKPKIGG